MCSRSAAHTHHCRAGNIHPSLSGENQSEWHFPAHPNTLLFLMQPFCTEGAEHWLWAKTVGQALQQSSQVLRHSNSRTRKDCHDCYQPTALLLDTSRKTGSCKDSTAFCSHAPFLGLRFVCIKFLTLLSNLSYQETTHYGTHSDGAEGGHSPWKLAGHTSSSAFSLAHEAFLPRLWSQALQSQTQQPELTF